MRIIDMRTLLITTAILASIFDLPSYSGEWSKFGKSITCVSPDFEINPDGLSKALNLPKDTPIDIIKPNRCKQKFENDEDIPVQIYGFEKELGVRVEIEPFTNMITVVALSKEERNNIKAVHLLSVINSEPYLLFTFKAFDGTGYRAKSWHFWGEQKQYRCPRTIDYLAVIEWDGNIQKPNKAFKFRARAFPAACE